MSVDRPRPRRRGERAPTGWAEAAVPCGTAHRTRESSAAARLSGLLWHRLPDQFGDVEDQLDVRLLEPVRRHVRRNANLADERAGRIVEPGVLADLGHVASEPDDLTSESGDLARECGPRVELIRPRTRSSDALEVDHDGAAEVRYDHALEVHRVGPVGTTSGMVRSPESSDDAAGTRPLG